MNKSYYNQEKVASGFTQFLQKVIPNIRKTVLNILPYILIGLIDSESVVTADISKRLDGRFSEVQDESVQKRIRRFFNNKLLDMYFIYDRIISSIIKDYLPSHDDKRVHVSFDHMFSKDNYTIFMFTLRLGKQGIPLWFRTFEGTNDPDAFQNSLMLEGIKYIINLFKDKDVKLVFLADRWFYNFKILNYINKYNSFFAVRMKANANTKIYIYDDKEKHIIRKYASDIKPYAYHSKLFKDVYFTRRKYKYNMAISKSHGVKEPWYIVTNMEPDRAIKDYGYHFGSIETVFKNEKTNGFYLENTRTKNLRAFQNMFAVVCIAQVWLSILGIDYQKNRHHYQKYLHITYKKKYKNKTIKIMSIFNLGLTIFSKIYKSCTNFVLKFNFKLYDL